MAVCSKCGLPFSYTEPHVCEGRDKTMLWSLATAAVGAIVGGQLGLTYARALIRQACDKPDATNLCGLTSAPAVPFYVVIGVAIGVTVGAFAVVLIPSIRSLFGRVIGRVRTGDG
jgi:hypothetical protein